jgi:hypothetical protein
MSGTGDFYTVAIIKKPDLGRSEIRLNHLTY